MSRAASNSRVRQSCMVCRQAVCRQAREAQLHWHAASRARRTAHCSCPRGHAYRTTSCGCGCEFPGVPVLIWTGGARNLVHWTGALRSARHSGRQRPCSGVAYAQRSMCDAILRYRIQQPHAADLHLTHGPPAPLVCGELLSFIAELDPGCGMVHVSKPHAAHAACCILPPGDALVALGRLAAFAEPADVAEQMVRMPHARGTRGCVAWADAEVLLFWAVLSRYRYRDLRKHIDICMSI